MGTMRWAMLFKLLFKLFLNYYFCLFVVFICDLPSSCVEEHVYGERSDRPFHEADNKGALRVE